MQYLNRLPIIGFLILLNLKVFAQNDIVLESNKSGYLPELGRLVYGSPLIDVSMFVTNGRHSLIVDLKSEKIILLDSQNLVFKSRDFSLRKKKIGGRIVSLKNVSLHFELNNSNTFYFEIFDSDNYANRQFKVFIDSKSKIKNF